VSLKQDQLSRRVSLYCGALALLCLLSGNIFAQSASPETSQPTDVTGGFLQREGAQPRFEGVSKLSSDARMALTQGRIFSVPHFSGSFESQGKAYPFTMVGARPQSNATTQIPVQIIPISLFFEEFADENGAPIILDPGQSFRGYKHLLIFTRLSTLPDHTICRCRAAGGIQRRRG